MANIQGSGKRTVEHMKLSSNDLCDTQVSMDEKGGSEYL
jgi:hypothetical protein